MVIGDVINDIIVRPRGAVMADSDTVASIEQHPGGSGANVAAWLGQLGAPVRFFGRVGAADVEVHRAALADVGVEARLTVDEALPTGTIVVVLDDQGRRTMYTDRGANAALAAGDVPVGAVETAAALHVSGYVLVEPEARAAAVELMARAHGAGVPVSVDPGSAAFIAAMGAESFRRLVAAADIVTPNLDEGRVLTGAHDPRDVVTELASAHRVVALTLGADGVLVAVDGVSPVHVPAPPTVAVDPTGAGDAFCAGFLHAYRAGRSAADAARDGVAVATEAVTTVGARPVRVPGPVATMRGGGQR